MKLTSIIAFLVAVTFHPNFARSEVAFEWAVIGNPRNANDAQNRFGDAFGGVNYSYRISKHEVTNAQYVEFLNAVDSMGTNTLSLYDSLMSSDAQGGINFSSGATNGSKYEIKSGRDNNPVVWVSYFSAMRFTNWLQNGQEASNTESGVYSIGSGTDEVRNPNAKFWIPNGDEWYKAAYHKNDGRTGNYWNYPMSSDSVPFSDHPDNLNTPDNSNVGNFFRDDGLDNGYDDGLAATGPLGHDSSINFLFDVGSYTLATSPYGTFDQGGNVYEWTEDVNNSRSRGLTRRFYGGDYSHDDDHLLSSSSFLETSLGGGGYPPFATSRELGFRIASMPIPEPSTALLTAMAACGVLVRRRRVA